MPPQRNCRQPKPAAPAAAEEEPETMPQEQEAITLAAETEAGVEAEAEDIEQTAPLKPDVPPTEPLQPPRIKYTITTNLEAKKITKRRAALFAGYFVPEARIRCIT